jgi:hypothetical protein
MASDAGGGALWHARRARACRTDQPLLCLPRAAAHAACAGHRRTDPRWPADSRARPTLEAILGRVGEAAAGSPLTGGAASAAGFLVRRPESKAGPETIQGERRGSALWPLALSRSRRPRRSERNRENRFRIITVEALLLRRKFGQTRVLVLPQAGVAACNLVWIGHLVELFLPAGELLHPRRARLAKPPHRTP